MQPELKRWWPALVVVGFVVAVQLNQAPPPPEPVAARVPASSEPSAVPRVDPAAVAAMKTKLLSQAQVADLVYSEGGPVEWQVGTYMRGSGVGYAETICMDLKEAGLVNQNTSVRMVNLADPRARQGDFRGASIGHVRCRDAMNLGT